jgi:hypothetical protein
MRHLTSRRPTTSNTSTVPPDAVSSAIDAAAAGRYVSPSHVSNNPNDASRTCAPALRPSSHPTLVYATLLAQCAITHLREEGGI